MIKPETMLKQIDCAINYLELDLNDKLLYNFNSRDYCEGYTHAMSKYYWILKDMFSELKEIVNDINKQYEVIGKHFDKLLEEHNKIKEVNNESKI